MGERSSDKYYYGTPIHQTDPISTGLLAVNESLGFRETSPGDVKPEHMVVEHSFMSISNYTEMKQSQDGFHYLWKGSVIIFLTSTRNSFRIRTYTELLFANHPENP